MKCKHYKGDGYTYKIGKQELNLCEQCEMELLAEMKKQEVLENKAQRVCNVIFEKDIERINKISQAYKEFLTRKGFTEKQVFGHLDKKKVRKHKTGGIKK